jgi:hypothetical protein
MKLSYETLQSRATNSSSIRPIHTISPKTFPMAKRKSKDDSEEPVSTKRSKASTSETKPVEKPEMKEDEQGLPYWEVKRHLTLA